MSVNKLIAKLSKVGLCMVYVVMGGYMGTAAQWSSHIAIHVDQCYKRQHRQQHHFLCDNNMCTDS